jgi:hypothetical protein
VGVVPGAYKVEFRTAVETRAQIVVVTEGEIREVWLDERLKVASAAPVKGSSTSHEYQRGPAAHESREPPLPPPPGHNGGSHLFLFVRDHDVEAWANENPALGLSLHQLDGGLLYDLGSQGGFSGHYNAQGHWTALHVNLDPGAYLLRLETPTKGIVQQVVHLCTGWQTQLFLLARSYGRGAERRRQADLARGSLFMAKPESGFQPEERQLYLTEVALRALADGRSVPGAERSEMMWEKFNNPMLGLFGAFLHLRRPRVDPRLMRTVFGNLRELLGPHPDVIALGWALVARWAAEGHPAELLTPIQRAVEEAGAMTVPPMLRAACDAVGAASFTHPGLVAPDSLAERVTTRMLLASPWLLWTATAEELRQTPLPPSAAPLVDDIMKKLRPSLKDGLEGRFQLNSIEFGEVIAAWEGSAALGAPSLMPPPDDSETVLTGMQRSLEDISSRLTATPELAERLVNDPSLTPLERRVALAAFPETDPLFAAITKRSSVAASALLQTRRPTAAELAASLGAPAGALSRAVLGLAQRVQDAHAEA